MGFANPSLDGGGRFSPWCDMSKSVRKVVVRVPATTANLGPGFDSLGVALRLYNTVTLSLGPSGQPDAMIEETANHFFQAARVKPFSFQVKIQGAVPISRGLGSSVTVRLGILAGLNALAGQALLPEQVLGLVTELEGHPDNAVPAFYGGFAACAAGKFLTAPVQPRLKFVALIPEQRLETKAARKVLPKQVTLADAVKNLQNTALITAAFCAQAYEVLPNLFVDTLHQPYRAKLLPCFEPVLEAARRTGALGGFLSGSGSTLMAVTLSDAEKVRRAMLKAAGIEAKALILTADNTGHQVQIKK